MHRADSSWYARRYFWTLAFTNLCIGPLSFLVWRHLNPYQPVAFALAIVTYIVMPAVLAITIWKVPRLFAAILTTQLCLVGGLNGLDTFANPHGVLFWLRLAACVMLGAFSAILLRRGVLQSLFAYTPIKGPTPRSVRLGYPLWLACFVASLVLSACGTERSTSRTPATAGEGARSFQGDGGGSTGGTGGNGGGGNTVDVSDLPPDCVGTPQGQAMNMMGVDVYTGCVVAAIATFGPVTLLLMDGKTDEAAPTPFGMGVRWPTDDAFDMDDTGQLFFDGTYGRLAFEPVPNAVNEEVYRQIPNNNSRLYKLSASADDACTDLAVARLEWRFLSGIVRSIYTEINGRWYLNKVCTMGGEPVDVTGFVEYTRDPATGAVQSVRDEDGSTYTFATEGGRIRTVRGPRHSQTFEDQLTLTYGSAGRISQVKVGPYPSTSLSYDRDSGISQIIAGGGETLVFTRGPSTTADRPGRVISVRALLPDLPPFDPFNLLDECPPGGVDAIGLPCVCSETSMPKSSTTVVVGGANFAYCEQTSPLGASNLKVKVGMPHKENSAFTFSTVGRHPVLRAASELGDDVDMEWNGPHQQLSKVLYEGGYVESLAYDPQRGVVDIISVGDGDDEAEEGDATDSATGRIVYDVREYGAYDQATAYVDDTGFETKFILDGAGRVETIDRHLDGESPFGKTIVTITRTEAPNKGMVLCQTLSGHNTDTGGMSAPYQSQCVTFNARGNETKVAYPGFVPHYFATDYDAATQQLPIHTSLASGDTYDATYDGLKRLNHISWRASNNVELDHMDLDYNKFDKPVRIETDDDLWLFRYSDDGDLISSEHHHKRGDASAAAGAAVPREQVTSTKGGRKVWTRKGSSISRTNPTASLVRVRTNYPLTEVQFDQPTCD